MGELTNLETKLGEVMGLAMAAQAAASRVKTLARKEHPELVPDLERMHREASETEQRCAALARDLDGKKTAIRREAQATKRKGAEMMRIYLDSDAEALDGFEFLTMAEAGEVGHWRVLETMSRQSHERELVTLCKWALPIQERHLADVTRASRQLAEAEDPAAVA